MKKLLSILSIAFFLTGCGGSTTLTNPVSVSISAIGGSFAFNPASKIERFFASLIGSPAVAKIDGLSGVGPGVTVNLIEIDASGAQVGSVIATATTNSSGNATLDIPVAYQAGAKYAIVGTGAADTLKSMWEGSSVVVDPGSHATMNALVDATSDLTTLDTKEILSARELIEDFSENLNSTEKATTSAYVDNLKAALQNDSEANKMLNNKSAGGEVCGTVIDYNASPVEQLRIFARDFSDFEKIAKTKTAADGSFCFNAPVGQELLVGVINRTTTNDSASEFYTSASPANGSGTKCHLVHCGDKLTVAASTIADFKLIQGGRITGTVQGHDGTLLSKVKVRFRNALTRKPTGAAKTHSTGKYTMNLAPGNYSAYFLNHTKKPYASTSYTSNATYNSNGSALDRNFADTITVTAGSSSTADGTLPAGGTLTGLVTDNNGDPVQFAKLRIDQIKDKDGNAVDLSADRFHSNKSGRFRAQLPYGAYTIIARGKLYEGVSGAGYAISSGTSSQTVNIDHSTNVVSIAITDGTDPLGSVTAKLKSTTKGDSGIRMHTGSPTKSDGTTTIYVPNGDYYFGVSVNNGSAYSSCNWSGSACNQLTESDGNTISINSDDATTFASVSLPAGFAISGTILGTDGKPAANAKFDSRIKIGSDWDFLAASRSGGDGKYTLSLGDQTYSISAQLHDNTKTEYRGLLGAGCALSAAQTIDFDLSNLTTNNRITVYDCPMTAPTLAHTISGTVTGADGTALANTKVWIYDSSDVEPKVETYTDTNGAYTIKAPNISSNTYKLKATVDTNINLEYKGVNDGKCPILGNKTIDFNGTKQEAYTSIKSCDNAENSVAITGWVKDTNGTYLADANVDVEIDDGTSTDTWITYSITKTNASGFYGFSVPKDIQYRINGKFDTVNHYRIRYKNTNSDGCLISDATPINFDGQNPPGTKIGENYTVYNCTYQ
jgi:protocatechuate 3,4-dioxygenase beta subunit/uncharacterized protein YegP (UPF0339 family)